MATELPAAGRRRLVLTTGTGTAELSRTNLAFCLTKGVCRTNEMKGSDTSEGQLESALKSKCLG